VDALILAGGENKRLPVLKGFLEVNGKRIIESNIELLSRIFDRVIISTDKPELYFPFGVLMLGDIIKYKGPMIGIFSALTVPEISEIFVTACDMPFIKPELIRYIVDKYNTQNIVPPTHPSPSRGEGKGGGENLALSTQHSTLLNDIAASFQASAVDVLLRKTEWAVKKERIKRVTLSGGVAANSELRKRMKEMGEERELEIFMPSASLCTDNAAMIAAAGYYHYKSGNVAGFDLNPKAYMPL
jgi:CTP:molybdopterin cytidylyltransferase MocA